MAWGKVDDKLHASVKWRRASKGARALWATALSWCSDQENDGAVPADMLRTLDGTRGEAESLVKAGLWDEQADGWVFHDWQDYNPDSASKKAQREAESAGGKVGNHVRWHVKKKIKVPTCEWCYPESGTRSGGDQGGESGGNPPDPTPISRDLGSSSHQGNHEPEPPRLETSIPSHLIPASWGPTTRHKAYAMENGLRIAREVEKFRGNAKASRKSRIDWDAEFDAWLAKSAEMAEGRAEAAEAPRPGSSAWDRDVTGQGTR
jgi:hypothetical protein